MFKRNYLKDSQHFLQFLLPFCTLHQIQRIFFKKDQVQSLNISEVIDSEKRGFFNARQIVFSNTFGESTGSWLTNTSEISTAAFSAYFSSNPRQIELGNISFSQMLNLRTVWEHVDCRSYVFSSLLRVIPATRSTVIISKILNIFSNIYCSFGIYIKSSAFSKNLSI